MEPQNPVSPDPLNPQPPVEPMSPVAPQADDPSATFAQPSVSQTSVDPMPASASVDPMVQPAAPTADTAAPASVAGPVPLAQPASMPAFMNPAPLTGQVNAGVGKKKSKLVLIIVAVLVLLVAGGGAAYALTRKKADKPNNSSNTTTTTTDDKKTDDNTDEQKSSSKSAITAKFSSEFDEVCKGGSIANSTDYTSNKTAIIYTFHSSPITANSWSSELVGYGKSYYLQDLDKFDTISVVACAKYIEGSASGGIDCEYESGGQQVTIKYQATKYKLTYYEAKTGKKISDGPEIAGIATKCPSIISYDKDKKTAYADPDEDALEAALDAFVK